MCVCPRCLFGHLSEQREDGGGVEFVVVALLAEGAVEVELVVLDELLQVDLLLGLVDHGPGLALCRLQGRHHIELLPFLLLRVQRALADKDVDLVARKAVKGGWV